MKGHKKKLCHRDDTISFDGVYTGSTYNGLPSGKGLLYKDKHEKYKGEWLNGKRHGYGIQYKRGGYTYKGKWQNNKHHGHGELSTFDFTYTGGFHRGKYHGNGYNCPRTGVVSDVVHSYCVQGLLFDSVHKLSCRSNDPYYYAADVCGSRFIVELL